jgi:hypothetical protein
MFECRERRKESRDFLGQIRMSARESLDVRLATFPQTGVDLFG